jgi:hypothetical protein
MTSSNRIAFAGKASDGNAILVTSEEWSKTADEAVIKDNMQVKVNKKSPNMMLFSLDWP